MSSLILLLELHRNRRSRQIEALAQAVFQEPTIIIGHDIGPVHENREMRRTSRRLRHIFHAQHALTLGYRNARFADFGKPCVELARGDRAAEMRIRFVDQGPDALDVLAGQC